MINLPIPILEHILQKRELKWRLVCRKWNLAHPLTNLIKEQYKKHKNPKEKQTEVHQKLLKKYLDVQMKLADYDQEIINWGYLSCQKLPNEFIDKYGYRLYWDKLLYTKPILEEIIEKYYIDRIYKKRYILELLEGQKLSESFLENHYDSVRQCPEYISEFQILSESFITRHADDLNWSFISSNQKLSEEFIVENQHNVIWYEIFKCQNISLKFIKTHKDKVSPNIIKKAIQRLLKNKKT